MTRMGLYLGSEAVRENDVEGRGRVCGMLSHQETIETIAVADTFILTSHAEAYPTVVFEALSPNIEAFVTPVGIILTIDHPRLHVSSLDEFLRLISNTFLESPVDFNPETLERFPMERDSNEFLDAFVNQCGNGQQSIGKTSQT